MSNDKIKNEVEQAVEKEREAAQSKKLEEEKKKISSSEPKRDSNYFKQLLCDFKKNHKGDARRFSESFAGRLAFDNIQGRWFLFKETHWEQDFGKIHIHKVTDISEDYEKQADYYTHKIKELKTTEAYIEASSQSKKNAILKPLISQQQAYEKRAKDLNDPARIEKVLKMAGVSSPGYLGLRGKEWNSDPYLFACANKVIDLRTGKALDPDPYLYINRASTIEWENLNVESPVWEEFLQQIFNGDQALIEYIHKCAGYWMTGLMTHQEFYCLWGPQGRNGKGVFTSALRLAMGSYAQTMPQRYLLDEKSLQATDKPDQHLVSLEHTRLGIISESSKKARFSEGAIKQLSGEDPITCRGMYSLEVTEFIPKFKMLFLTNRIPSVNGDDKAFQERLRIIKLPCTFRQGVEANPDAKVYPMDPYLKTKMFTPENLRAILAWCVRGAIEFLRSGNLTPPESVLSDTKDFMESNDFIGEFISTCLDVHPGAPSTNTPPELKSQMKDIYEVFQRWCSEEKMISNDKIQTMNTLGKDFRNRTNFFRVSPKNVVFYNVTIKPEFEKTQKF